MIDQRKLNLFIEFIKNLYPEKVPVPLHEPCFGGKEKSYLQDCIDSTFVSSVGKYVDRFEDMTREFTGAGFAVATVNGTAALHIALLLAGVEQGDLVLTQALTFVATCNAISYCGAEPVFIDIDRKTLGMDPDALEAWLAENAVAGEHVGRICGTGEETSSLAAYEKQTGKRIAACVPMHTFGHACELDRILDICGKYGVILVEDSAESLGTFYKGKHTGTVGKLGVFSYNGNKTITTGGGGMVLTDDERLGKLAKYITTTAKRPHPWEFRHDMKAYNYRLPNLNAALGCAQMEMLADILVNKRDTARLYSEFCADELGIEFVLEPEHSRSNYWLNAILLDTEQDRDEFLRQTNASGIITRPAWIPMHRLEMYKDCLHDELRATEDIAGRLVNLPSSVRKR